MQHFLTSSLPKIDQVLIRIKTLKIFNHIYNPMLNLTEQLGFDYGYANSNFGLWCPLFDCFLLVGHDQNLLSEVQLLISSKILTIIIELELGHLNKNIIDNEICSNWTIENTELVNFTLTFKDNSMSPKSKIIPKQLDDPEEVNRMQIWITFVIYWIKYLKNIEKQNYVKTFVNFVFFSNNNTNRLKQKIYKILLINDNIELSQEEIKKILCQQ
jgi:hypothetical protein